MLKLLTLAGLAATALAHGVITTPTPRQVGPAALAACGTGAYDELALDKTAPVEYALRVADSSFNATACDLFLCRGLQLADNTEEVQTFTPGTVVPIQIDIAVRHTGYANVSVIDLNAKTPIARLFTWPVYANNSITQAEAPANETMFNVTIPDLGDQCSNVGDCAIQWWWFGTQVNQTYESCVDFTQ